jgi:hypothetical protein
LLRDDLPYGTCGAHVHTHAASIAAFLVDRHSTIRELDRASRANAQAVLTACASDFIDKEHQYNLYFFIMSRRTPFIWRKVAP